MNTYPLEEIWYPHAFGITALSLLLRQEKKNKKGREKSSFDPEIPDA